MPDHEATHGTSAKAEEFVNSGDVYFAQERYPEAIIEYKNAIQRDRASARARLGLGLSYLRSRRVREARDELREAVRLDPTLAEAHAHLCRAGMVRQDVATATEHARKLKELKPDDPVAANDLAAVLLSLGKDLERAHQLSADLRKHFPESPIFADTYGWTCYRRGEYQKAVESLAFAATRRPRWHELRYHYGMALYKAGEVEQAQKELRAALELSQEFEGAAEAKAALAKMSAQGQTVQ